MRSSARHKTTGGALTVPTYEGGVAAAPLVQQSLPTGAWQVTTKVSIDPSQKYQQAGLLLYASDTPTTSSSTWARRSPAA